MQTTRKPHLLKGVVLFDRHRTNVRPLPYDPAPRKSAPAAAAVFTARPSPSGVLAPTSRVELFQGTKNLDGARRATQRAAIPRV